MERVAFLIEDTNERLGCLLNPETLVIRRSAGVRPRRSAGGQLTGAGLRDDPLLFTGGGRTELELELLFDISLAGSSITTDDVRELTTPLWNLAENATANEGYGQLRRVRFLWGKYWDIPGVVVAVAERLEHFTAAGAPQRSWLRLRIVRVDEAATTGAAGPLPPDTSLSLQDWPEDLIASEEEWEVHETVGGGDEGERGTGERLDQLAEEYYGDASLWRLIAKANDIDDPTNVSGGQALRLPPLSILGQ
ncbi:MAG: hypothetical protein L0332_32915 [Chloroflexi bacterium]|nr:hypothetical protein [Chloroflexota bacterium]MCI0580780.1 hypothetical protein [Chloroflexota bacterium]MCI0648697.1 hypothetical protein [Chloroflexota bacterium]MCI0731506.1 hypothetical protein [Chloroflexota bacterium]